MSRIGKQPIQIPPSVSVTIDGDHITVANGTNTLTQRLLPGIVVRQEADQLLVTRTSDEPTIRAKHGLMRSLLQNMVTGVEKGFSKQLEINGVGYRVNLTGSDLTFNLGLSHEVTYHLPPGITAKVEQNVITVSGIDKQQVGQVAAEIRALRKPEPYKGKGIKYVDERIIRKSGKSGKEK